MSSNNLKEERKSRRDASLERRRGSGEDLGEAAIASTSKEMGTPASSRPGTPGFRKPLGPRSVRERRASEVSASRTPRAGSVPGTPVPEFKSPPSPEEVVNRLAAAVAASYGGKKGTQGGSTAPEEDVPEVEMVSEEEEDAEWPSLEDSQTRRRPGRPPTTGGYYEVQRKKALLQETQRLLKEREVKDREVEPTLSKMRKVEEKKALEEYRMAPTLDLPSVVFEHVKEIDKVATNSSNMSGTYKGLLKKAAAHIKAATTQLSTRVKQGDPVERDIELEELRGEIAALKKENEALRAAREKPPMTGGPPISIPPPARSPSPRPVRGGSKKRKRTRRLSSSEDEEMPESSRDAVIEEIATTGMPPAVRPAIQGKTLVLEEAVPPVKQDNLEDRLLRVLTAKMEGLFAQLMGKLAPSAVIPPKEELRRQVAPPNPPKKGMGEKKSKGKDRAASTAKPSTTATAKQDRRPPPPPSQGKGLIVARTSPPAAETQVGTWATVVRRGRKTPAAKGQATPSKKGGSGKAAPPQMPGKQQVPKGGTPSPNGGKKAPPKASKRRVPSTAAVILTCPEDKQGGVMTEAKERINLASVGITEPLRPRRALTGALRIEIPGQGGAAKADALAAKMTELFAGREDIRITRPTKMAELRVMDLDDSSTPEEVVRSIAAKGGCPLDQVKLGPIRRAPSGLGVVWARCPLVAAKRVVTGGRITIGWFAARVQLLDQRPLQCFKCLEGGHVRAGCTSAVDRSGRCYRCGGEGHRAQECTAPLCCPICADLGRPANHRAGSKACPPSNKKGGARPRSARNKEGTTPGLSKPGSASKEGASQGAAAPKAGTGKSAAVTPGGGEPLPQRPPRVVERKEPEASDKVEEMEVEEPPASNV